MLSDARIHPTISVVDFEEAKKFYGEILGLKQIGKEVDNHIEYEGGVGTRLLVYQRGDLPKAENTAAGFTVKDVVAEVKLLKKKGVVFEDYDFPGLKTVNGVATIAGRHAAWFKDPAGNILAISDD